MLGVFINAHVVEVVGTLRITDEVHVRAHFEVSILPKQGEKLARAQQRGGFSVNLTAASLLPNFRMVRNPLATVDPLVTASMTTMSASRLQDRQTENRPQLKSFWNVILVQTDRVEPFLQSFPVP